MPSRTVSEFSFLYFIFLFSMGSFSVSNSMAFLGTLMKRKIKKPPHLLIHLLILKLKVRSLLMILTEVKNSNVIILQDVGVVD